MLFRTRFLIWLFEKQLVNSSVFMVPSVLFDYVIWVAIFKYQTPPKGGKGGCAFIAWISIFEVSWGFELWLLLEWKKIHHSQVLPAMAPMEKW